MLSSHSALLNVDVTTRIYDFTSYSFDFAWENLLLALCNGACLCVPDESERKSDTVGSIVRYGATFVFLTPSLARNLDIASAESLRTLLLGGEAFRREDFLHLVNTVDVFFAYGPSECTIFATAGQLEANATMGGTMGRAVASNVWIVDPENHAQLSPVGAIGEIWIEGGIVARGYLDAEQTSRAFISSPPWLTRGGQPNLSRRHGRTYRTGDLARYYPDGSLEYIGRKDTQIKLRGQRLELEEVEYNLRRILASNAESRDVSVAVEVVHQPAANSSTLVAFLISLTTSTMDSEAAWAWARTIEAKANLAEDLSAVLPAYMIPTWFIPLSVLPTTASGKTARRELRELGSSAIHTASLATICSVRPSAPSGRFEKLLHEIWTQTLNVRPESISVDADFSRLGGDSITAMLVMSRCRSRNVYVPVASILRERTIRRIAQHCKAIEQINRHPDEPATFEDGEEWDLSPIQRIFFQANPLGNNHFTQSFMLQTNTYVAPGALRASTVAVANRHAMLRAKFRRGEDGRWRQAVSEKQAPESIFSEHIVHGQQELINLANTRQHSLDIERGLVFTVHLIKCEGVDSQFVLCIAHHLVVDLVSWRIIWHDLEDGLNQRLDAAHGASFRAWCREHSRYSATSATSTPRLVHPKQSYVDFWKISPDENTHDTCVSLTHCLDEESTSWLLGQSNDPLSTEPQEILLGVLCQSFRSIFADRKMPYIHLESHGRNQFDDVGLDVAETVGWFTTLHPLEFPESAEPDVCKLIGLARDMCRSSPKCTTIIHSSQQHYVEWADIECLFNYTGQFQQLENKRTLFRRVDDIRSSKEVGEAMDKSCRLSLLDVNTGVTHGRLEVRFTWSARMAHQVQLQQWFSTFAAELKRTVKGLAHQSLWSWPKHASEDDPLAPTPTSSPFDTAFDDIVQESMYHWRIPGAAFAVVNGDQTWCKGYGFADASSRFEVEPSTLFQAGSTSKAHLCAAWATYLASEANQARADQERITWKTRLVDIIGAEFILSDGDSAAQLTLEDALSHRSGMPRHDASYGNSAVKTPRDVVINLRHLPMHAPSPARFEYCNLLYTAASYALEIVTGKTLPNILNETLWAPMNMQQTFAGYTDKPATPMRLAKSYAWTTLPGITAVKQAQLCEVEPMDLSAYSGAAYVVSSVKDYSSWMRALLFPGDSSSGGLPFSLVEDLWTARIDVARGQGFDRTLFEGETFYGLGWFISTYRDHRIYHHTGDLLGCGSWVLLVPSISWGITVFGNSNGVAWKLKRVIMAQIDAALSVPSEHRFANSESDHEAELGVETLAKPDSFGTADIDDSPSRASSTSSRQVVAEAAGVYINPGYGSITLIVFNSHNGGMGLHCWLAERTWRWHLELAYLHDDIWSCVIGQQHGSAQWLVQAESKSGTDGKIKSIGMALETSMPETLIWFDKVV